MLASIKLEVMSPSAETPDEGSVGSCALAPPIPAASASGDSALYNVVNLTVCLHAAVEFHMPPICSPLVRPGRPAEAAPVISKALEDVLLRFLFCLAVGPFLAYLYLAHTWDGCTTSFFLQWSSC
jgi:exosome complex component RRP43